MNRKQRNIITPIFLALASVGVFLGAWFAIKSFMDLFHFDIAVQRFSDPECNGSKVGEIMVVSARKGACYDFPDKEEFRSYEYFWSTTCGNRLNASVYGDCTIWTYKEAGCKDGIAGIVGHRNYANYLPHSRTCEPRFDDGHGGPGTAKSMNIECNFPDWQEPTKTEVAATFTPAPANYFRCNGTTGTRHHSVSLVLGG